MSAGQAASQNWLALARRAGFFLAVFVFVGFWLLAFTFQLVAVFTGWFDPALVDTIHFVHNVAGATWLWIWGLAMVVQFYRPARRVLAMQVALLLTLFDLTLVLVTPGPFDPSVLLFFGPVFVAAALHPARGEVLALASLDRDAVDLALFGLSALMAAPMLLYVVGQVNYQFVLTDEHAAMGHYGTMGYFGLSLVALALLASLRPRGRRAAAYAAAVMMVAFAVASVFNPTMSGLTPTWSALAVLWAVAFVGTYEWRVRSGEPTAQLDPTDAVAKSPPST